MNNQTEQTKIMSATETMGRTNLNGPVDERDHVGLTILTVSRRIVEMQDLLRALYNLQDWGSRQTEPARDPVFAEMPKPRPVPETNLTPRRKDAKNGRGGHERTQGNVLTKSHPQIIETVRGLTEPINARAVMTALNRPKLKDGSNVIDNYKRRGWLKCVSVGQYVRTKSYPNGGVLKPALTPALSPKERGSASAPATKPDQASLRKQLDDACKQRDAARLNGRDSIVEVFQKDIDRLEAALES